MTTPCNGSRPGVLVALAWLGGALALLLAGCATGPGFSSQQAGSGASPVATAARPAVFPQPMVLMHKVVLDAMETMNCPVFLNTQSHLKGRLRTGEMIEVFLESAGEKETRLWVNTRQSFVGGAYQTNRNQEVLNAIRHALDRQ